MTSGGNNFNDFPKNQLTTFQLGGKNITILHTFAAPFQYNLSTAEKRDIWRPGKALAGTQDIEAKIRDVSGNTGRLATLVRRNSTGAEGSLMQHSAKLLVW